MAETGINTEWGWGWNSGGGITPASGGLVRVRLLETRQSLCLRLDTQGYIAVSPSQVPVSFGLTLPALFFIDVFDSPIEVESVIAIATFFCGTAACSQADFSFSCWGVISMMDFPDSEEYDEH